MTQEQELFRSLIAIDEARERHKLATRLTAEFASANAAGQLASARTIRLLVRAGVSCLTNVLDAVIARMPTFWAMAGAKHVDLVQIADEEIATCRAFVESELSKALRKCADKQVWQSHLSHELKRFDVRASDTVESKVKALKRGINGGET